MFIINLTLSFCSVLGEAVVVELAQLETENKDSKAKDYVSMFFLARTVGELLSSYLKGLFVDIMHLRTIFLIGSFIPVLLILSGVILIEKKITREESSNEDEERGLTTAEIENNGESEQNNQTPKKSLFNVFIEFLCQKFILIPIMFIIIFKATPSYNDSFFYYITNELKINATSLGKISFCSTIAILIAILFYKAYLKNCNFKFMIIIGTIISFFISLACFLIVLRINIKLGIPDFWLLLFTNSFLSLVGELVLLPILSLACVLCPKNLEGTVYAVFMSSLNFGGILSHLNGGFVTSALNISTKDYSNLHWLILIAKFSSLLPLPMLFCIDDKYFNPETKKEIEEKFSNTKEPNDFIENNDENLKKKDINEETTSDKQQEKCNVIENKNDSKV
jgi:hypothetical protein